MQNFIGRASGATLGFIAHNTRGAVTGYKLGGRMAKRQRSLTSWYPRKKNKITGYGGTSRRSSAPARRSPAASRSRRTKRRRNYGTKGSLQSDAGSSGFRMSFKKKTKFMKGLKKILAPQILNTATQQRLTVSVSRQTVAELLSFSGSGSANPYLLGQQDMNDMQSILAATEPTGATQNAGTNPTPTTRRLMVNRAQVKYTMKNQTNVPIEVTLYDVTARRDATVTSFSPSVSWNNGIADEIVTPGPINANAQGSSFPGAKPFQSQLFCQLWKVKKSTHFFLAPGSAHTHYITIKPSGVFNNEYTRIYNFYKGITTACMAVVKGGVVQDTTTPFNVTFGTAELDIVAEANYSFTAMERSRTAYTQYSTLPNSVTVQGTVLEDTDTVAAVNTV